MVFHERQEGALCAQHALNSLLQGAYYTAVDLADLARTLDEREREQLAAGDYSSPAYLRSLQADSQNMDDSGFFSVQVKKKKMQMLHGHVDLFNRLTLAILIPFKGHLRGAAAMELDDRANQERGLRSGPRHPRK
eukprot:m.46338 g.46338  ORF g.46338 m.46338 type:complete len:135 (-) comp12526_c0_seq4:553-957(-)